MKRKSYSPDFKAKIVLEILAEEKSLSELSSGHGVHVNQLRKWKKAAVEQLPRLFSNEEQKLQKMQAEYEREKEELYAELGRTTTQLNWLKKKSGILHD